MMVTIQSIRISHIRTKETNSIDQTKINETISKRINIQTRLESNYVMRANTFVVKKVVT